MKIKKLTLFIIAIALFANCQNDEASNETSERPQKSYRVYISGQTLLSDMKVVNLPARRIKDLEWIRHMKRARSIVLSENPIVDIEPLRELENVETLNLSYTYVSNLEPLSDYKKMYRLNIRFTKVKKIHMLPHSLQVLAIDESVDPTSIAQYQEKNPKCKIIIDKLAERDPKKSPTNFWQDSIK